MTFFKRKGWLLAGLALIALSNCWILASVAYNRSGEPEAVLLLSERELRPLSPWQRRDSSELALQPNIRTQRDRSSKHVGAPLALQTMRELGFDLPDPADEAAVRRFSSTQSRQALLVLEMDGPAYQAAIQDRREALQRAQHALARFPDDDKRRDAVEAAEAGLQQELIKASRLFLIDAGLDADALRQRYPDRQRYWLVRGAVAPWVWHRDKEPAQIGGRAQHYDRRLHVPHRWRQELQEAPLTLRYSVEVYVGQRHDPWINWISTSPGQTRDDVDAAQR